MRGSAAQGSVKFASPMSNGSGERLLASLPAGPFEYGAAWSPDGKTIAASAVELDKQIRWVLSVIRVADGQRSELYSSSLEIGRPVWMPDGESLHRFHGCAER